jgi:D-psicose/D-tagatose/L-ribulose 3-epimerase
MKLGINLLCLTDFVTEAHLPAIRRLKEIGYDGVEVPVLSGDTAHYEWLARKLDAIGLERCASGSVPSPDADPVSSDPAIRARGRQHLDWALDCTIALGAQSLGGPMHAPIGHFTGSGPTESELNYAADAHRDLATRAAANGAIISLEPLNRFETYFLNTVGQCEDYLRRVGHDALRIMYDTFHSNIEDRNMIEAAGRIAPHIGVLHVSENDRGIPGRGHIDFKGVLGAVRHAGYDGWVTLEAFGTGLPGIAAATRVWRPLFPDYETLFVESAAFIRNTWNDAGAKAA